MTPMMESVIAVTIVLVAVFVIHRIIWICSFGNPPPQQPPQQAAGSSPPQPSVTAVADMKDVIDVFINIAEEEEEKKEKNTDDNRSDSTVGHHDEECVICLSGRRTAEPAAGQVWSLTKCGHGFHQACILEWVKVQTTCPICRKSLLNS